METIFIGCLIGGAYSLSITLYKYASNSSKFTHLQIFLLYILIIFPPLQYVSILIFYTYNYIKNLSDKSRKQLKNNQLKINNLEDSQNKLTELRNLNIISDTEYLAKKARIENQIDEYIIENRVEYKNLESLYKNCILSEFEFKQKIDLLQSLEKKNRNSRSDIICNFNIIAGYHEGLALAIDENLNYGFVDDSRNTIIPFQYNLAQNFSNGLAVVMVGNKYGYINKENMMQIDAIYDLAEPFSNNIAKVNINGEEYMIDKNGEKI